MIKALNIIPLRFLGVSGLFARCGGQEHLALMLCLTKAGYSAQRKKQKMP